MIHHVSISAREPKHVADVLAELMKGRAYPFPGGVADSFMAVSGDEYGSMIEVYPGNVALVPGQDDKQVSAARMTRPRGTRRSICCCRCRSIAPRWRGSAHARGGALGISAAVHQARRRHFMSSSSGWRTGS